MPYPVYFNYLNDENKPVRKKGGWFDIPLPYDLHFEAGEIVKITFDLRVKIPDGFEGIIQPRSSTLERTGLISSGFGVIEDCYCGENDYIGYRFYATKDGLVSKGSCLVQMRFQEKMKHCVVFRSGDEMFKGVQSRGGFGSTDESKDIHINQLNWEPETEYQQGFDEGHMDGYEEGFADGYDRATEDAYKNFDASCITKAQKVKHGDYCPFNLWNYTGAACCICLPADNDSCGVLINENCPFRKKVKNA